MKSTRRARFVFLGLVALVGIFLGTAVPAISGDDPEKTKGFATDPDLIPSWRQITVAEAPAPPAEYGTQAQPGGERIKTKSPVVAFLLGGIVGFGSGQFYSGKRGAGYLFLGADIILWAVVIGGWAAFEEEKDESFLFGIEESLTASAALSVLAGSHVIQALWGAYSAAEYNKSVSLMHKDSPAALNPRERDVLAIRLSWRF